jgi:2-polyprenyl-3-methyl-5-hydroxy-6-metoxy-1,4-benzoquinol methylase
MTAQHNGNVLSRDEFIYTGSVSAREEDSRYRLAQLTGERAAILDVGCAVGYIGEFLRRNPPQRWLAGIELDAGAAERARPHYDQLIVGSIEEQDAWDRLERKVDAMIFGDVLEHTADPVRVLQMAKSHLTDEGIVIVSMPNVAHFKVRLRLLIGRFEYEEWGIMDRTHLRFFTRQTAQTMLRESGFEVLHSEAIRGFSPVTGGSVVKRLGRAARTRVRNLLVKLWPTMFAKQFILVGMRLRDREFSRQPKPQVLETRL